MTSESKVSATFSELDAAQQAEATSAAVGEFTELLNSGVNEAEGHIEVELSSGQITNVPFVFVIGSIKAATTAAETP